MDNTVGVRRADLDGTNLTTLVSQTGGSPHTLVVNKTNNKIYWADSNSSAPFISRANLSDGSNQETLLNSVSLTNPFGLVAIPEPSTYALLAGALGLGIAVALRHRRQKQLT